MTGRPMTGRLRTGRPTTKTAPAGMPERRPKAAPPKATPLTDKAAGDKILLPPQTPVNGWIVIDKPLGLPSTQVVRRVRRALNPPKTGHGRPPQPIASRP